TYKSFAIVGGGTLGLPIVSALAAQQVSVILLSRPGAAPKTVPSGVQVVKVDFTDALAVAAVFKEHKVDVVLSTLNVMAAAAQKPLVEAARLAAVKMFAPSEYGFPTEGRTEASAYHQLLVHVLVSDAFPEDLKAAGIPSVRFYTGIFTDIVPWLIGYPEHGKVRIVGTGEASASFTSIVDIAGFVTHVLTALPPSEVENRIFRLEGERACFNDLAALFNTSVERVDRITGDAGDLKTGLMVLVESGVGSTGWDEATKSEGEGSKAAGSANALWPGHQWKTIKEVHRL
ncbi:hypothetical protein FB451DRAFT_1489660, partial [Mycena latifolia]